MSDHQRAIELSQAECLHVRIHLQLVHGRRLTTQPSTTTTHHADGKLLAPADWLWTQLP
ncbi:hypothetical protein [Actinopolymorpha rutila]|uniref:Uncharacterized protein n=1 Tax=Actinopolymorpha rutila TaxID=446787 RepID=A0A852Z7N4_9ACTN|nr:hypothetical protein [Actinopolymorpha rutila]NYH87638.1 hypothetical protein [Actinopolymorpha rutila]